MSIAPVGFSPSPLRKEREECGVNPFIQLNGRHVYSILTNTTEFVPIHSYPTKRKYSRLSDSGSIPIPFHRFTGTLPFKVALPILENSDLEIIPDNSNHQEFNQIRESDACFFLPLYDAIAQDKTCLKIFGSKDFKEAVLKDIQILLTRPGGRRLIGSICCTLKNYVIIQEGKTNEEFTTFGDSNSHIRLNLNYQAISPCRDRKGEVHFKPIPSYIALAHELIHVLHRAACAANPDSLPSPAVLEAQPGNDLFFKNLSEKLTICGLAGSMLLCENTLRAEFDLMPRISHVRSGFLSLTPQDLPNIDTPNQDNFTRLQNAVYFKAYGEIRRLLKAGANPENGFFTAILGKDTEMVRFLLSEGASPNKPNQLGDLPLHLAAKCNLPEIVKLLIDQGVSIVERDVKGQTPLQAALENKSFHSALLLIANGAPFTPEALESIPDEPGLREAFRKYVPPELDSSNIRIFTINPELAVPSSSLSRQGWAPEAAPVSTKTPKSKSASKHQRIDTRE